MAHDRSGRDSQSSATGLAPVPSAASLAQVTLGSLALRAAPRLVHGARSRGGAARDAARLLEFSLHLEPDERELVSRFGTLSSSGTRQHLATDDARLAAELTGGALAGWATLLQATAWASTRPTRLPAVWGVLNATPDSFSDGDPAATPQALIERGLRLEAEGADVIDVGGESTRPGAEPVDAATEAARVLPVIRELARQCQRAAISVDTSKAEVARRALDLGARWINDPTGGEGDRAMLEAVAASAAGYVCMHRRGTPRTMQVAPHYDDAVTEICEELRTRLATCLAAGVEPHRLLADPGLGFGKRLVDNLDVLEHLSEFRALGVPLFVGASRKAFVGTLTGVSTPRDRLAGSLAAAVMAAERGAEALRVHDVRATVEALQFVRGVAARAQEMPR